MVSIGVDIGGTKIAACLVNDRNAVLQRGTVPFPKGGVPAQSICVVRDLIEKLLISAGLSADDLAWIGLAVPGSIDYDAGTVVNAYNLNYHNFPLKREILRHFPHTPIFVENDANAAALAELHNGVFYGFRNCVLLTLGTGVGGGAIINGRLFTGGMKNGFEIGHMVLQHGGLPCNCGNTGCAETLCSASALTREGISVMHAYPESLIAVRAHGEEALVDAKLLFECANAHDNHASAVIRAYIDALGSLVTSVLALFDPEVIAIGGGVSNAGERLLEPLRVSVASRAFFDRYASIVRAKMGNDAGMFGAAMLGKNP